MKYKLGVLYGAEACVWADEHPSSVKEAIKQIKAGKIFGDYKEYEFANSKDRETATILLEDAYGWDNNMWSKWEE